ncbi:MAG: hypothetical protein OEX07_14675 [Gammaproteobacteria bacterium]|nr:hypothetical protein [Gammaproteobacteria bacterium]
MSRGDLTEQVSGVSYDVLEGYMISQEELWLMPYVQFICLSHRQLDIRKLNSKEVEIINDWCFKKRWIHINPKRGRLVMSKFFWDAIHKILEVAYANAPMEPR